MINSINYVGSDGPQLNSSPALIQGWLYDGGGLGLGTVSS